MSPRRATPPLGRRGGAARWQVADAHEQFLAAPDAPVDESVRRVVAESWLRSWRLGVDPQAEGPPLELDRDEVVAYREQHPLAGVMPMVRHLLTQDADEAGHIVAVGDARGRLMWVEGDRVLRHLAERMHFVEGALWSESGAGTNAPGTALALGAPVQIAATEHFGLGVQPWSCVAAPIRHPRTGDLLGVLDLTGGDDLVGPRSLALVRACATAIESHLLLATPRPPARRRTIATARGAPTSRHTLRILGTDSGRLHVAGAPGRTDVALSRRHTEIVWLLAMAQGGMTVQALDAALHHDGSHLVTVRAEMARLRRVLDGAGIGDVLASRPYRLTVPLVTDVDDLRRLLARGAVHKALDLFAGPPLPGSDAPAVVRAREELVAELRGAVVRGRSTMALERWTALDAGHDDAMAWELLERRLPYGSPKRATARVHRWRLAR